MGEHKLPRVEVAAMDVIKADLDAVMNKYTTGPDGKPLHGEQIGNALVAIAALYGQALATLPGNEQRGQLATLAQQFYLEARAATQDAPRIIVPGSMGQV